MPLKVLLVDDHPLFRAGVAAALQADHAFTICGEADHALAARELARQVSPDAAIVDLLLQNDDGLRLVRELRQEHPRLKIVVLSMLAKAHYQPTALQARASFFVSKQEGPVAILAALHRAAANERAHVPSPATHAVADLSERERQVFLQLGLGRSTAETAEALGVSVKTISTYKARLMVKLNVSSNADLIKLSMRGEPD